MATNELSSASVSGEQKGERTSADWWQEVKADEERFNEWLRKQYHGEVTAAERIKKFAVDHAPPGNRWRRALLLIGLQETKHAAWVGELLLNRGIEPELLTEKPERYWSRALAGVTSFEGIAAQAAWAERMRLERIRVISDDPTAPADVRTVFSQILVEEEFHAKAFSDMAGDQALSEALARHEAGMAAIGVKMESEDSGDELIPGEALTE